MRNYATYVHSFELINPVNVIVRRVGRFEVRTSTNRDGRAVLTVWREFVY